MSARDDILAFRGETLVNANRRVRLGSKDLSSSCLLLGAGSSANYETTATANALFIDLRLANSATSGDNRGMYLRLRHTGAGGGGEAARIYTEAYNVAAGTAHGAHISLGFGSSGRITGLGAAVRATTHVPATSTSFGGTVCALQAEFYSDATGSTLANTTQHSVLRLVNDGHANGKATMLNWMSFVGANATSVKAGNTATPSAGIRVLIDGAVKYLVVADDISTT